MEGTWILVYMMLAVMIGTTYIIMFIARILTRIILSKQQFAEKRIYKRWLLIVSVALAVLLSLLFYEPMADVFLIYQ